MKDHGFQVAAFFQLLSGVGVILVGACGPEEIDWFHVTAAVLGFGGSGVAQVRLATVRVWH